MGEPLNPEEEYVAQDIIDPQDGPPPSSDSGVERDGGSPDSAPPPSIRDTLANAIKGNGENQRTLSGEQPRGPDGKFAPKDTAVAAAPKGAPAASPPTATTPEAKPATQASSNAPAGPPPGWSPESKAAFSTLPPSIQADVIKREQEVNAGFQQYAGLKQRNDDFERAIAPNRHIYASEGVSDAQAIANIWQWFHAIKDAPDQAFPALAQMVGFDLSTVGYAAADGAQQPSQAYDPNLVQALSHLDGRLRQFETMQQQQQRAALDGQIRDWSKDKPHFQTVRQDMGRLMHAGVVPMGDLDAAYAYATSAKGLSAPSAAPPSPAAAPTVPRAVQARHAAVSPRPTGPNGSQPSGRSPDRSIRESLQAAIASG